MKISILGCGWLGLPLGALLVKRGHSVMGSTTSESKFSVLEKVGIQPFLLNFSPAIVGEKLEEFLNSEILIICIPPRASKFGEHFHVEQIESLLNFVAKSSLKKIIYTSSTSVYPSLNQIMTEEDAVEEHSSLVKVEKMLISQPKVETTILRCGGLMGAERIGAKYYAGKTINTGNTPVNYVHQEDVIGIISLLIDGHYGGEIFNVVSPKHPFRKEVFLKNCKDLGFEKPIFEEPQSVIPFKIISADKLIAKTGYQFIFDNPLDFTYKLS
jgi:nucleoside-diphosphate-sugar epimerase